MELFTMDGHLTEEALQAVMEGSLDDLQGLETAEHLSFCDECVVRYSMVLTEETLYEPPMPVAPSVMHRIRRRTRRVLFNRYTRVAAAACFALMLWTSGTFTNLSAPERVGRVSTLNSMTDQLSQQTLELTDQFSVAVSDFLHSILFKGAYQHEKK